MEMRIRHEMPSIDAETREIPHPIENETSTPSGIETLPIPEIVERKLIQPVARESKAPDFATLRNAMYPEHSSSQPTNTADRSSGTMGRLAKSKIGRVAFGLVAALGLSKGASAGIEHFEESEMIREQAKSTIRDIGRESSIATAERYGVIEFTGLPSPEDEMMLATGEVGTRAERLAEVNARYTALITRIHGPMGTMIEQCTTQDPDDGNTLDAIKCDAIYGNQVNLGKEGEQALEQVLSNASGYTPEELAAHGKIIRDSIMFDPGGISFPGATNKMYYFDYNTVTDKGEREEIYNRYYDDASKVAFYAVRTLGIEAQDKASIEAVQRAIKSEIRLANTTLQVSIDILEINNSKLAEFLMHDTYNTDKKEMDIAHITQLHTAFENADLAWRTVAAIEGTSQGPMHEFMKGMHDVHHGRIDTLLRAGRDIGDEEAFFLQQLEKIDPEKSKKNTSS